MRIVDKARTGVRLLIRDRTRLLKSLRPRKDRFVVFSAAPEDVPRPDSREELVVRRLSVDEIQALAPSFLEVEEGLSAARFFAGDAAWGAVFEGRIAHVAWVFAGVQDSQRCGVRLVRLNRDEAEITHCFTLPEFRGRRIYPFLIRSLIAGVADAGVRRVFMITTPDNFASQRGIREAGLAESELGIWWYRFLGFDLLFRPFRWGPLAQRGAKAIERIV